MTHTYMYKYQFKLQRTTSLSCVYVIVRPFLAQLSIPHTPLCLCNRP